MTSNDINYEALAGQIGSILGDFEGATCKIQNEAVRRRLMNGARKLSVALERNRETLRRIGYAVCLIPSSQLPLLKVLSLASATTIGPCGSGKQALYNFSS